MTSILEQSFHNLELICVNDASTDESGDILRRFAEIDGRVKVISLSKNLGAGEARNIGIQQALGEYLTFVDADDELRPGIYEKAVNAVESDPADYVIWGILERREKAGTKEVQILPKEFTAHGAENIAKALVPLEDNNLFGYLWNSFYKTEKIKENSLKMESCLLYEDYFFNLEFIRRAESIKALNYPGYIYNKRKNDSITNQYAPDYFKLAIRRVESFLEYCETANCNDDEMYITEADRLMRSTLSALARNRNPFAGMDGKARRNWFLEICELSVYKRLSPWFGKISPIYKPVAYAVRHRNAGLAGIIGFVAAHAI